MQLTDWCIITALQKNKVAVMFGITPVHLSRLLSGARGPSKELMAKIKTETNGLVTEKDWNNGKRSD